MSSTSVSMTQVCGCVAAVVAGGLLLVLVGSHVESSVWRYIVGAGLAVAAGGLALRYR